MFPLTWYFLINAFPGRTPMKRVLTYFFKSILIFGSNLINLKDFFNSPFGMIIHL